MKKLFFVLILIVFIGLAVYYYMDSEKKKKINELVAKYKAAGWDLPTDDPMKKRLTQLSIEDIKFLIESTKQKEKDISLNSKAVLNTILERIKKQNP